VYSFTAPATGDYSFRITGYDSAQQPVLYVASNFPSGTAPLLVNSGILGANRDTSSGTVNSSGAQEATGVALTANQTVYVFVDDDNALNSGSAFTVEVNAAVVETEPNDFPSLADTYNFGVEGSIGSPGDKDYFQLGTPAAGSRVFAMIDGVTANTS